MLKGAESNAELKRLDVDSLVIGHIQVNKNIPNLRHAFELVELTDALTYTCVPPATWR